ncbi:receptor-type tyrosine-protein phosphatase epsilon-like [Zophobas morio]|uniref:receptor-type tyrosine-protein phosphatase epsilon-like n=1 Tax=Zophobas morio TaxID=2755281 RepID=UPI003083D562
MNHCIILFILWKTVDCQNYCVVSADDTRGLFIFNSIPMVNRHDKDDTEVDTTSEYTLSSENVTSGWTLLNSLENSIVDDPVIDERWETFMNNHGSTPHDFREVLTRNVSMFLSVRIRNSSNSSTTTELSESKWYHLKSNASGICENGTFLNTNLTILQLYNKYSKSVWKIHKYDYFHTTNNTAHSVIYSNDSDCSNHSLCFFIYTAACKNCSMLVKIVSNDGRNQVILDDKIPGEEKWTRKEICVENVSSCYKITIQTEGPKDGFWAIYPTLYVAVPPSINCSSYVRYIELRSDSYLCEDSSGTSIKSVPTRSKECAVDSKNQKNSSNYVDNSLQQTSIPIYWWYLAALFTTLIIIIIPLLSFIHSKKKKKSLQGDAENLLENSGTKEETNVSIKRIDFSEYVQRERSSNFARLRTQFSTIPDSYLSDCSDGKQRNNVAKNRRPDIVPYNYNRVRLKNTGKYFKGDYINASYVQGPSNYREYIIAQNPQTNTIGDFWAMIWQKKITYCVMITGEHENYLRYWPNLSEKYVAYDDFQIILVEECNYTFFQKNRLSVTRQSERREISILHYYAWKDDDLSRILAFVNRLQKIPHYSAPTLFHCLDGTGRSGLAVLCDIVLRSLPITGSINICHVATMLIKSRINAINSQQYIFAHLVINDFLKKY